MDYNSEKFKSYLQYYQLIKSSSYYDSNELLPYHVISFGEDIIRNFKFIIGIRGDKGYHYPCSYIRVKFKIGEVVASETHPHGGYTYQDTYLDLCDGIFENENGYIWLGWDYIHPGDYNKLFEPLGKKYTSVILIDEVIGVYEDLVRNEILC